MIGAKGDRMLGLVARHADEWNMWSLPETFAERSAALDRRCEAIGRDPGEITRSTQAVVMLTDDADAARALIEMAAPRAAVAGTAAQIAETVAGWRDVGVDEVIIPDFALGEGSRRADALDDLIENVVPAFRDA